MGCRLVRGETIYFVRHGGPTAANLEAQWYGEEIDSRLLPSVFVRTDGRSAGVPDSVVPIEIRTFDA